MGKEDVESLLAAHGIHVDTGSDMTRDECVEIASEHFMLYHAHVFREDELAAQDLVEIRARHGLMGACVRACMRLRRGGRG
jgi:hypothetical protein